MNNKKNNNTKFQELVSKTPSGFIKHQAANKKDSKNKLRSLKIALNVLTILDHKKMTQVELAQKMNVSAQQVSKLLKGKSNLTLETINKLEEALNVTLIEVCQIDYQREQRNAEFVMSNLTDRTMKVKIKSSKKTAPLEMAIKTHFKNTQSVNLKEFSTISEANNNLLPTG